MRKGFFTLTVVLIVVSILVFFLFSTIGAKTKVEKATLSVLELEEADFIRFQLEENVAYVIRKTLEQGLSSEADSIILNQQIANKLEKMLKKFANESQAEINLYITDGFTKENLGNLAELSRTIITKDQKSNAGYGEYVFTGGLLKNKRIVAEIKVGKSVSLFEIKPGYTIAVVGIG